MGAVPGVYQADPNVQGYTGSISAPSGTLYPSQGGTIYAGGKATYLPNKDSFYQYVSGNSGLGAQQFSNNPWGVSDAELEGLISSGGSSSSSIGGTTKPTPDFGALKQSIFDTAGEAAGAVGSKLRGSILDFIDQLRAGQSTIDRQGVQNELSRLAGTAGVRSMVGQGIRSGGVVLANKNASNSSAAEGIAKAYGTLGQREMSKVGNQFALGQNALEQSQADLGQQQQSGIQKLGLSKEEGVNNIVMSARNSLAALDAEMQQASLPDRINIEQEKQAIKDKVLTQLQQFDKELLAGVAGINPTGGDTRRLEAIRLANAGVAPDASYDFTSEIPSQFQNTGPFASGLPIFTFPKRRTA